MPKASFKTRLRLFVKLSDKCGRDASEGLETSCKKYRRAMWVFTGIILLGCAWESLASRPARPVCEARLLNPPISAGEQ